MQLFVYKKTKILPWASVKFLPPPWGIENITTEILDLDTLYSYLLDIQKIT